MFLVISVHCGPVPCSVTDPGFDQKGSENFDFVNIVK